jgi:hypothetical protein
MSIQLTIPSVLCALQRGLLGTMTPNVREVQVSFTENSIDIFFYYDNPPTEEEEELSEEASTEVFCSFIDIATHVHRIVLPYPRRLPQDKDKIPVYYRWEKPPKE